MRYLILGGCGAVGASTVAEMVATAEFDRLTICDLDPTRVRAAEQHYGDKRVVGVAANAADKEQLAPILRAHDLVVNCTPGHDNVAILKTAIETGTRYMDITGSMLPGERMALDESAKQAGVLAVIAMGCSPGLTNAAAAHGVQHLDSTREITIDYATLRPLNPSVGLLDTALRQYTSYSKCPVFENGELRYEPPYSGARRVTFPAPIGEQVLYYQQHSEPITIPRFVPGVRSVKVYGTYHVAVMNALRVFRDHGLMQNEPVEYEGRAISPRGFLTKLLTGRDIAFPGPTHYCLIITVQGRKDGAEVTHTYTMTHDPDGPRAGELPQVWMTAVGTSVGAQLMCTDAVRGTGVMAPEGCIDPGALLRGAAARGYDIQWETHTTQAIGKVRARGAKSL